jgi:hypothetical protein
MPESTTFQGWYPPQARALLSTYLHTLHREYALPVIDARCWIGDELFWDSHHLLRPGAAAFTQRFAETVLEPLFRKEL